MKKAIVDERIIIINNDDDDDVYKKKTPIFRTWHYSMALSFLGQRDQIRSRMQ